MVAAIALLVGILWVPENRAHASATPAPTPLEVEAETARGQPTPLDMVALDGGTFTMGSTEAEIAAAFERCRAVEPGCRRDRFQREGPTRSVTLAPFLVDRTEVTNEQFTVWLSAQTVEVDRGRLVRANGVLLADLQPVRGGIEVGAAGRFLARVGQARKPVVQVTWYAAQRFCRDGGKRLPTEAEWEYAARGLTGRRYPWGDREPACTEVDIGSGPNGACGAANGPDDVGSAVGDVTPDGVRGLGGSVAEWVADVYVAPYPACDEGCRGPLQGKGDQDNGPRVIRGGDWNEPLDSARSAGRTRSDPGRPWSNLGFRCAKDAR
jgi:formylglycine-generating enzyme required for sulfatase activity